MLQEPITSLTREQTTELHKNKTFLSHLSHTTVKMSKGKEKDKRDKEEKGPHS
jgi:hypothetical protein